FAVKHARDAFGSQADADAQWRALNFTAAPDVAKATEDYDRFLDLLRASGAVVDLLPPDRRVGLDSIYVRDASIAAASGMILARMGTELRSADPGIHGEAFASLGIDVEGAIRAPGTLEGGAVVWLHARTVAVGRGYRTNENGIRQ